MSKMVELGKNHILIVGSGIVGCVLANELANKGKAVTLVERRGHLGGNLYDFTDPYGIRVHKYGPHIFHTKKRDIYEYVSRFCQLKDFHLVCGAVINGKCVPTAFNFTSIDTFFPAEKAIKIKDSIKRVYGDRSSAAVLDLLDSENPYIREFAEFLYDTDYSLYTAKQWGIPP